jgi:hypothetical protein
MTALTLALVLLAALPGPVDTPPGIWEIAKGTMLFVITGGVGFMCKLLWGMRDMVVDHESAIYGHKGENGLKRGLKAVTDRVDLIEDRNTGIDAVAAAEKAEYHGPERRHQALQTIVDMVKQELQQGKP